MAKKDPIFAFLEAEEDAAMAKSPLGRAKGTGLAGLSKFAERARANEITEAKKPSIGYRTNIPKVGEAKPEMQKRSINLNPDYAADDELRQINSRMQPAEMRKGGKVKKSVLTDAQLKVRLKVGWCNGWQTSW